MDLDWYCTDMLKVRHQCRSGLLWTFSSLKRQRNPFSPFDFTCFTFRQNKVAIVSSVIANIFNPSKYWTVTIQFLLNDTLFNQFLYCLLPVVYCSTFVCSVLLFDSVLFVWFNSFVQCSNYSVYVLSCSWKCILGISILLNINHQAVNKHHIADSIVFCLSTVTRGLLRS